MAERYTFAEIRNFKVDDVFWSSSCEYKVTTEPVINEVEFYGEKHHKAEFDAYCNETMRERHFAVADVDDPMGDETFPLYKTSVSHDIEGSSPLQPRQDTETFGEVTVEVQSINNKG